MGAVSNYFKLLASFFFLSLGSVSYFFSVYSPLGIPPVLFFTGTLLVGGVLFFRTFLGVRLWEFFLDSYTEIRKVVWPSRKETLQLTFVVFCFVLVLALYLAVVDALLRWALYSLVLGWSGS